MTETTAVPNDDLRVVDRSLSDLRYATASLRVTFSEIYKLWAKSQDATYPETGDIEVVMLELLQNIRSVEQAADAINHAMPYPDLPF